MLLDHYCGNHVERNFLCIIEAGSVALKNAIFSQPLIICIQSSISML